MTTTMACPTPSARVRNDSPLHVAHGVHSLNVGGLERIVVDLAEQGARRGQRVTILCTDEAGAMVCAAEAAGAEVISLGKSPGLARITGRIVEVLGDRRPDVLHTHTPGALWHLGPAAAQCRIPVLHTEHIDNVGKAAGAWSKLKTRLLWQQGARYAGRFCCVSHDIARSARRWGTVPGSKVDVVLNGIDTNRLADTNARQAVRAQFGIPADARVVGTVARLNEVKRQDLILRAAASAGTGLDDVHVLLVGDGPERANLERLSADLGIAGRVHFAGFQPNPERFLPAMDVFALTSRLEGLPLALLEAWAAGVPVVSSAVGGVPKAVRHGQTGLLFPSGNLDALTTALITVLGDPALAERLSAAGRQEARERYSLDRMATEYEARYRDLLAARSRRPDAFATW